MLSELWTYIKGIGDIYIEEELIVGFEPVLFVCKDKRDNRYLFETYDSAEGVFIFIKISNAELLNLLYNRNTMEDVFRRAAEIYVTDVLDDGLDYTAHSSTQFDGAKLPKKGEYFELQSKYICEYIRKIEMEQIQLYVPYQINETIDDFCISGSFQNVYECLKDENTTNIDEEYVLTVEFDNEDNMQYAA